MSKDAFIKLYKQYITREGADPLLEYIESTDFFTAPASTRFHLCREGGLCEHSLNVCRRLSLLTKDEADFPKESIAIVGLLHDLCKANFYVPAFRNRKNEETGVWEKVPSYNVEDKFPIGHGAKSVILIMKYMQLTEEEIAAIVHHMGPWGSNGSDYSVSDAFDKYSLALYLHLADMMAAHLDEVGRAT